MKKIFYCVNILLIAFVLFSCKSKEVVSEDGTVVEENDDEKQAESDNEDDNEQDPQLPDEVAETLMEKEIADRGFIGWIDSSVKNPTFEDGLIKIETNSKLGTFCIFAVDSSKKAYPVLSPLNEYTSSSFYLKAGKKIFKLAANDKVDTGISELEHGLRLVYDIKNTASIIIEMESFPALKNRPADTLKFTITVKNMGKKVETFALKTILDTVLGENGKFHFYNCEGVPIKNEALYRSMKENKWFLSKNDKASVQLLFDGGDVTPVEFVSLANYRTLEKAKWLPTMQAFGAFDTVLSYNNSAVGVIWPEKRLYPSDSYETVFYISVGLDGMVPNGYKYVYNIETPEPVEEEPEIINVFEKPKKTEKPEKKEPIQVVPEESIKAEIENPVEVIDGSNNQNESNNSNVIENHNDEVQEKIEKTDENVIEKSPVPENIEFNVKNISKDHLTTGYIQSLIDRIAELENAGASANRGEILQLNAELDAILSIIR